MKREIKIGWWVLVGVVLVVLAGVAIFAAREAGRLHYTIVFEDAKGLQAGDRVQLSGIDIGVVRSTTLHVQPTRIEVAVRIDGQHAPMVLADSTAIIRNVSIPNVSGQMIVEVFNSESNPSAPPMQDGSVIKGQEGLLGLKAWQFKNKIGSASDDLSGVIGLAQQTLEDFSGDIQQLATSPEVKQTLSDLRSFMQQMQQQGVQAIDQLRAQWPPLKERLTPLIQQLNSLGRDYLSNEVERLMQQVEETLQLWSEKMPQPAEPSAPALPQTNPTPADSV